MTDRPFAYTCRYAGRTDVGKRRSSNQDRVILSPELSFFGVSDGMGGLLYGDTAAEYVSRALPVTLEKTAAGAPASAAEAEEKLRSAVDLVSDCLCQRQNADGHVRCGATLAGVWLTGDSAVFTWLGDSRGYLLPKYKKTLLPMTKDMNVAQVLLDNGDITPEEAKTHPGRSQLTAFVGMPGAAETAVSTVTVHPGDRLLLCSDGLYGMVDERTIIRILRSSRSPEKVCERLIDAANAAGGRDNIAAVYLIIR